MRRTMQKWATGSAALVFSGLAAAHPGHHAHLDRVVHYATDPWHVLGGVALATAVVAAGVTVSRRRSRR